MSVLKNNCRNLSTYCTQNCGRDQVSRGHLAFVGSKNLKANYKLPHVTWTHKIKINIYSNHIGTLIINTYLQ